MLKIINYFEFKKEKYSLSLLHRIFRIIFLNSLFYNSVKNIYANGDKKIKLSILSNIPPCPGIKLL